MDRIAEKTLTELIKSCKLVENKGHSAEAQTLLIAGITYFSRLRPNISPTNPLSMSEMFCLIFLAIDKNPDQCADLLGISVNSVTTYEQRARKKIGAKNRTHAFYIAQIKGFISVINH